MTYLTGLAVAASVVFGVLVLWYLARAARAWHAFRGERVVTCPETGSPAAVRIDSAHAAVTTVGSDAAHLRLAACSRWEARGRCDEACMTEAKDPGSMLSAIACSWRGGKRCVYCGEPLRDEAFVDHHAAVLGPDGTTREWSDVAPDQLPDALRTGWPVCWNCHVAETFRRQYPFLVTDRTNTRA